MDYYNESCDCRKKEPRRKKIDEMPVAMAYVPWQYWSQVYSPEEGLCSGTIFPELKKPFYGRAGCTR